jgi:hypothetical protein
MPRLDLYNVGEKVQLIGMPLTIGRILSKTNCSVSVDVAEMYGTRKRYTTTWAPATVVALWIPPKEDTPPESAPSQPQTPQDRPQDTRPAKPEPKPAKAETRTTDKPKGKAEVDVFGVRKGTMAAAVNEYMLKKRTGITVADVLTNVSGSKKDNVTSHLRRMVKDKLITNKGEGKDLLVSVPKGVK